MTEGKMFILDANAVEAAGRWGSVMAFLNKIKPEMMAMIELVRDKKAIKVHISIVEVDIAVPKPRVLKTKENQNVADAEETNEADEPDKTDVAGDDEPTDADLSASADGQSEDTGKGGEDENNSSDETAGEGNAETSDSNGANEELELDNVEDEFADVVNEENDPAGKEGDDKTKGEG